MVVPMQSHSSVAEMVQAYADQAIAIAREFKAELDSSEDSLLEVAPLLAPTPAQLHPHHLCRQVHNPRRCRFNRNPAGVNVRDEIAVRVCVPAAWPERHIG